MSVPDGDYPFAVDVLRRMTWITDGFARTASLLLIRHLPVG